MANAKSQMTSLMQSLREVQQAGTRIGATICITNPPSMGPCLLCLIMFQARNGGLAVMAYNDVTGICH